MTTLHQPVHLVITVAGLREWPKTINIPTYHLKSNTFSGPKDPAGVLLCVTGMGLEKSREAAMFISEKIKPLYVLNIGSCGSKKHPPNTWLHINAVKTTLKPTIELSDRLPFLWPKHLKICVDSVLSLETPEFQKEPRRLKEASTTLNPDNVDMECFAQAQVFSQSQTSFHALKYVTDDNTQSKDAQYKKNISYYINSLQKMLDFLQQSKKSISVIIPTYNRATKVCRAIQSVLDQNSAAQELIVIDDASTDNTLRHINDLFGKHPLIKVMKHTTNLGVSAARNTGIQAAECKWLSFLDSDDYWTASKLKHQRDYLNSYPFYSLLQSEEIWIRNDVRVNPHKHHQKPLGWAFDVSLQRCLISPSSVLVHKQALDYFGNFNPDLIACEDYDLWLRLLRKLPVGLSTHKTLVKTGGHPDQLSKLPLLDLYRIKALYHLFKQEEQPQFQKKIKATWLKKYHLLKQGAIKHNNHCVLKELKHLPIL